LAAGLVVLAVLVAYATVWRAGFIWDDDGHVTPPGLRTVAGLWRIWAEPGATQQYYPLLHSAFWVLHRIFGDAPAGYHVVNVLLHAANAVLVGTLLRRLSVPGAWLAAGIFALHPVMVESVAWVSELKNTLSGCLYLAAALAWLRYEERRQAGRYAAAFGLFALALLTKTVTATLPAAMLVVAWWRRGRLEWARDVRPLLPFFVAGGLMGWMTARVEAVLIGAEGVAFEISPWQRAMLAGRIVWFYVGKLFWPAELAFWYPRWEPAGIPVWWSVAVLVVLAGLVWLAGRERGPLAGALFFGGTLFPVLGFLDVYPFQFSFVADHFQYLAALGIIVPVSAGVVRCCGGSAVARAVALMVLGVLGWLSFQQAGMYRSARRLYEQAVARSPESWIARIHLGRELQAAGEVEAAAVHYVRAIELAPEQPVGHYNLGTLLARRGRMGEAVVVLERAVQLRPGYAAARHNLGSALATLGRIEEAAAQFAAEVRLKPDNAVARSSLGQALLELGQAEEAVRQLREASRLAPGDAFIRELLEEAEGAARQR
jgi:tetratricopeptide (TPR) repeat protein